MPKDLGPLIRENIPVFVVVISGTINTGLTFVQRSANNYYTGELFLYF